MNALTIIKTEDALPAPAPAPCGWYENPLDADAPGDAVVVATRRGLTRLALIAAETGARFQRDGACGADPMAWLLAPRRLFGGMAAIEACLNREHFMRGLILHGLSLGLDAEPADVDDLLASAEAKGRPRRSARPRSRESARSRRSGARPGREMREARPRLFTAIVVHAGDGGTLQAFHASIGTDPAQITERLAVRYGDAAAGTASVRQGFDPTTTFAEAMVSPALCDLLALVDAEPASPLAAGLDVNLEQRFAA